MSHGGRNLDQFFVDNPPMKQHGTTMITDQVFLGSYDTSHNEVFITKNYVTHIINTNGKHIPNFYDLKNIKNKEVKLILEETKQLNSRLIGTIQYLTLNNWDEHKVNELEN